MATETFPADFAKYHTTEVCYYRSVRFKIIFKPQDLQMILHEKLKIVRLSTNHTRVVEFNIWGPNLCRWKLQC